MTVIKLDDGQYRVDMRPQGRNGKRIRKTFKTKSEAQIFERHTYATQNNKDWLEKPADRRPLSELIELWWKHYGNTLKSGQSMYKKLINIDKAMNSPRAHQITKKSFADYQAMRIAEGRKPETINKALWLLSGVFTVLIENGNFHSEHPLKGIRKSKVNSQNMGFLSVDEMGALLNNLSGDNLKAAKLSLSTGGRWGEIINISRSSVIKYKVTYLDTKNGRNRTVPISESVYAEIIEGNDPILFPQANYKEVRQVLRTLFPWLPDGQAVHVLRHTFASHFMMNGGNILTLQKILGHASINQTMAYAHFAPDHLQDAVRFNPLESK